MDLEGLLNGAVDVVFARSLAEKNVDGEGSTRDGVIRGIVKESRELSEAINPQKGWDLARRRTFSAFMVAEVTINFRSLRRESTVLRISMIADLNKTRTHSCGEDPSARRC